MNSLEKSVEDVKPKRDWFNLIVGGVIGLLITVCATWYQQYNSDKEATEAELERSQSVRNSVISIVEEQALNNVPIDPARVHRIIEQRRRENKVSLSISINDVVEQAEFNIASSPHLSIHRKEEIKDIFENFYGEIANRTFEEFSDSDQNSQLLNEIARSIKNGKTADALNALKSLNLKNNEKIEELERKARPSYIESFIGFVSDIRNIVVFLSIYLISFVLFKRIRHSIERRRGYRL